MSGAGIDCPSDCTEEYSEGTIVPLTPVGGGAFAGWSGDCTGQASDGCAPEMTTDRTVNAHFFDGPPM